MSQSANNKEKKGRIAITLPKLSLYGGVEQFGYRLSEALAKRGYQVDFICARQEIAAPDGVNVITVGRPRSFQFIKMLVFALKADKIVKSGDYDSIIGLGKTFYQDVLRVGGGPLREAWRYTEMGFLPGFGSLWKKFKRRISLANRLTLYIEKIQYSSKCRIVPNSHFVKEVILDEHPYLNPDELEIIYNKPDLGRFHKPDAEERKKARASFGIRDGVLAVGFATGSFPRKGTDPLVRCFSYLPDNFHLFIAGGRGHALYDRMAEKLGIAERIHFLGRVEDMPSFYQALDVYALPSFFDACSNTVVEALATGLPVVSSKANGSSFFIPKENVVDDPLNLEDLAAKICNALPPDYVAGSVSKAEAFAWPEDVKVGMGDFIEFVEADMRKRKESQSSKNA